MGFKTGLPKLLAAMLTLCLLIGALPKLALPTQAAAKGLTLEELREKFPDGKYWNGPNPDGWTDSPCTHHRKCTYDGSCGCNTFLGQSTQCMGFAEKLGYDATGYNPRKNADGWYTNPSLSALNNLKPGDIIRNSGHSVYVIDVQGSTVTFADCNYNGNCNIRWGVTKDISTFKTYFQYVRSAPVALSSGYLAQCERLSSEGTVEILNETTLWTSPCTGEVYENSQEGGILQAGDKVSVLALYGNTLGEYWYKIILGGQVRYLRAADTHNFHPHSDAISAMDVRKPVNVQYKYGFSMGGLIRAEGMMLTHVGAYIYPGMDITGEPCMTSEDSGINQISYQISGSNVDKNLKFGQLAKGTYTYVLRATAANRYADRGELSTWSVTQTLHRNVFTVSAAATSDYLEHCQRYICKGTVVLTEETALRNVPCEPETNPAAVEIGRMESARRVAVTGLYRNTLGQWWYETEYDGLPCYISAGNTVSFRPYEDKVTATGIRAPSHNQQGSSFSIRGLIGSDVLPLSVVGAYIYSGTDINAEAHMASEITEIVDEEKDPVNYFELGGSIVDYNLTFGKLDVGSYTYVVKAYTVNYYADENVFSQEMREHILHRNTFAVSQKLTCAHSYEEQITQPATCVSDGLTTYRCTACDYSYTQHTFATGVHTMGDWDAVVPATCQTEGYAVRMCTGCDVSDAMILPAAGHSYEAAVTPPTIAGQGYTTHSCDGCGDSYRDSYTEPLASISRWNVTLADDLRVNFYPQYHESVAQTAQVHIKIGAQTRIFPIGEQVSIHITPAQINDTISVQLVSGEDVGAATDYRVYDYAQALLADESQSHYHNVVKALLCYGIAAQTYFDYRIDALPDWDVTDGSQTPIPASADSPMEIRDRLDGVDFAGASLLFENRIAVRFYFKVSGDIAGYTFTSGGKSYTPVKRNDLYYIEIGDILPQNLQQSITVSVGEDLSVAYSPMNYIVRMNQKGPEGIKPLLKALYNYHLAAKAQDQ